MVIQWSRITRKFSMNFSSVQVKEGGWQGLAYAAPPPLGEDKGAEPQHSSRRLAVCWSCRLGGADKNYLYRLADAPVVEAC
jgi:hypothetical protein